LRVQDVKVKDVVKVDSRTLVENAVKVMNRNEIGCLIIEDDGVTAGTLTHGVLLKKVLEDAKDPRKSSFQIS